MRKVIFLIGVLLPLTSLFASPIQEGLAAHGYTYVQPTPALTEVAAHLAKIGASADGPISSEVWNAHLRYQLDRRGISDATVWLSILRGANVLDSEILSDVLPKLNRGTQPTFMGLARREIGGQALAVTVLLHQGASLQVDKTWTAGAETRLSELKISGGLSTGYFQPSVVIESNTGQVVRIKLPVDEHRQFSVSWRPQTTALSYRIELVAENVTGPCVLNVTTISSGKQLPTLPVIRVGKTLSKEPTEALQKRIARLRRQKGVDGLNYNASLAAVAQNHAEFLAKRKRLAHRNHAGGHLRQRLKNAGIRPQFMSELLVYAPSPLAAFGALTDSPAHLEELFNTRVDHIGIGMVNNFYVVVLAGLPALNGKVD